MASKSKSLMINVLGLGYIGLPTALLLAKAGHSVSGYDVDEKKIQTLKSDKLYFEENGLSELFFDVTKSGKIQYTSDLSAAEVHVICVPTPTDIGKADLKYVFSALQAIKGVAKDGDVVIIESTIGPNDFYDEIKPHINDWEVDCAFALCTERAIPGNTLFEMIHNDRVIGVEDEAAQTILNELYGSIVKGEISFTDIKTAAVVKVIENTYRSVNIAFANELAKLSHKIGFNVWEAIELANRHPRVNVHSPGPGVGGHCIPVDPYFLVDNTDDSKLISASLSVNEGMSDYVAEEVQKNILKIGIENPKISILGYAYKKNVDDSRETPSIRLKKSLVDLGFKNVFFSDPYVQANGILKTEEALRDADVAILVTDHDEYQSLDFSKYNKLKFIYDTRAVLSEPQVKGKKISFLGK